MAQINDNQPQVQIELPTKIINQDITSHQPKDPLGEFKRRVITAMLPPANWSDIGVGLVYHICIPGVLAAAVRMIIIHQVNIHWTLIFILVTLGAAVIGFCCWLWQAVPEVKYLLLVRASFVVVGIVLGGSP